MAIFRRDSSKSSPPPRKEPTSGPFYKAPDWQPTNPATAKAVGDRSKPIVDRAARSASSQRTLIAAGTHFRGTLSGPTELVIEGEVEGEVRPDNHLEIGARGKVVGDIAVRTARISGHVVGNVVGLEVVELTATGRLEGDVKAPRVVISEGAFFRGNVQMTGSGGQSKIQHQGSGAGSTAPKV
jgi:cytoskeletal protein CcmA (bactofilin family)